VVPLVDPPGCRIAGRSCTAVTGWYAAPSRKVPGSVRT
jgi:hypothetical protein